VMPDNSLPGGGGMAGQLPTSPPGYVVIWVPGFGFALRPIGGEDSSTKPVDPAEPK